MESGQLKSPKFPNNYPNDKICYWTITVPFGFSVTLNFEIFEVSINPPPCQYDYVEIRDGGDQTSELLGRFCGKTLPGSITSTGNQLFVKFHSDLSTSRKGFSASFFTGNMILLNYLPLSKLSFMYLYVVKIKLPMHCKDVEFGFYTLACKEFTKLALETKSQNAGTPCNM
jgi:hypothetical protein